MPAENAQRLRLRAAYTSVVVALALLALKFAGWSWTGSETVFSDAMESIVNVVASIAAVIAVVVASRPPDQDHPYGHGKVEFLTAAFEGGLIAFAALVIVYQACVALVAGPDLREIDLGLAVVGGAGVVNLILGVYLVRTGRKHHSRALVADGRHVLSDTWTSLGAVVGLLLVRLTGELWIDPVTAIVVAINLMRTGIEVVREAVGGLMDEQDPELIDELAEAFERARFPGIIEVHELRVIQVGAFEHVDAHVVVPEFWTIDEAHHELDRFERAVVQDRPRGGELQLHTDPCEQAYCSVCDLPECPARREEFAGRRPVSSAEVVTGPHPTAPERMEQHPAP